MTFALDAWSLTGLGLGRFNVLLTMVLWLLKGVLFDLMRLLAFCPEADFMRIQVHALLQGAFLNSKSALPRYRALFVLKPRIVVYPHGGMQGY